MKRTWQPKKLKRKRVHGFRKRMRENYNVIVQRRSKGRYKLTV